MQPKIRDADQKLLEELHHSELVEIFFSPLVNNVQFIFSLNVEKIRLELEGIVYMSFTREQKENGKYLISEVVLSGIGIRESAFLSSNLSYHKTRYEMAHSIMDINHNLHHLNIDGEINIDVIASRYEIQKLCVFSTDN